MKKTKTILLVAMLCLSVTALITNPKSSNGFSQPLDKKVKQTELVIGISDPANRYEELVELVRESKGEIVKTISTANRLLSIVVSLPLTQTTYSFITKLKAAKLSRYIEFNEKIKMVLYEPNDPEWRNETHQWSLWDDDGIRANWAWNTTLGTQAVRVAVIDSGIDYTHEDLTANYKTGGYDWVNDDENPMDDLNHGTHCAGIIGAEINNSKGIAGISQVEIIAEKCIDSEGYGTPSDLAAAILHAVDNCSVDIISMSLGFLRRSEVVYDAVKHAYDNGVLLVAAAGNDGWEGRSYPAAFDEVIAVTATDENGERWEPSTYGQWVELAAPGFEIFSTIPETEEGKKYDDFSGTSMACPHVVATAALIWSQYPNMTRDQVRIHLRKTARDFGVPGFDKHYGYGLVDANASVSQAPPNYNVAIMNWERPSYVALETSGTVNTTVLNYGTSHDWVNVTLLVNGTAKDSELIGLQGGETSTVSLSWTPQTSGVYNVTSHVSSSSSDAEDSVSANVTTEVGVVKVPLCRRSIQDGVDAAQPGDTIWVAKGEYREIVNVWKDNLTIQGENKTDTVVDCRNKLGWGFVSSYRQFIHLSGFTVRYVRGGNETSLIRYAGILFALCSNCTVTGNIIAHNSVSPAFHRAYGLILTHWSMDNVITDNVISFNEIGMAVYHFSLNNLIVGNHFYWNYQSSGKGLVIDLAWNNTIYHNNFIDNAQQVVIIEGTNQWHGRWNVTGNYWSDYNGTEFDEYLIGLIPYVIDDYTNDTYPFKEPWLLGDIIHNGEVDWSDYLKLSQAYGSEPEDPNWDPHADLNEDGKVDYKDTLILSRNYGATWQDYWA